MSLQRGENLVLLRHINGKHEGTDRPFDCNVSTVFGRNESLRQVLPADETREKAKINTKTNGA